MIGKIVRSVAGRDRGKLMVIVEETEDHLLVCDGKERPLERPKRKKRKHLHITNQSIKPEQFETNRSLRRALAAKESGYVEEEKQCQNRI